MTDPLTKFLSKEVSGRNVGLDEVIVPSPELQNSSSQKSVLVISTPISKEANDDALWAENKRSRSDLQLHRISYNK